jgi:hypothetical protein
MPAQEDREPEVRLENRLQAHIVSPVETTDRLQAIQRTIATATGDAVPDFQANVVRAIPVQAGGQHPISDVWYIEPALDAPGRLRAHIAQLAAEMAQEASVEQHIHSSDEGIGFFCESAAARAAQPSIPFLSRAVLTLLSALSAPHLKTPRPTADALRLADDLAPLLQGTLPSHRASQPAGRLSDSGVVKLFRLIRLARRLMEVESGTREPVNDTSQS